MMVPVFLAALAQLPGEVPSWEGDIEPIVQKHCVQCHSGDDAENAFKADAHEAFIAGGKTGAAISPGSLRDSLVWTFIATDKMPASEEKLTREEKNAIRLWILADAPRTRSDASKLERQQEQSSPDVSHQLRGASEMSQRTDELIEAKISTAKIKPAPLCDDAEFLRRVYLDLNGRIPSYKETTVFLSSNDPKKRAQLIEQRLASPEFGRHFAIVWHKLLIPKSAGAYDRIPHEKFRAWLADQFNENRRWNELVSELITAEGYLPSNKDTENNRKKDAKLQPQNIATAFINVHNTEGRPQPKGIIASVSRLFLAQSIECAQCHNHPMAKWEQTDFWAAAAFFERVRYEKAVYGDTSISRLIEPSQGKELIYNDEAKARYSFVPAVYDEPVIDLQDANGVFTGKMIPARFLDGAAPQLDPQSSHRVAFAGWLTAAKNPFFARAITNRLWAHLTGRGFVEPVDDMSEDNPPSHPRLLAELSAEMIASDFDLKHVVRCICLSETYQRSSQTGREKRPSPSLFAAGSLKQFTAEQLLDSLAVAAPTFAAMLEEDARDKNPGLERKAFLDVHETSVESPTEHTRGLQQALRMMNGDGKQFNREAIADVVSAKAPVEENIRRVYLKALNRAPLPAELTAMVNYVQQAEAEIAAIDPKRLSQRRKDQPDNTPDAYADVFWVLINSGEFIFNH